jgi:membrane protease subunit HflK
MLRHHPHRRRGDNGPNQGPPDLDELWRDFNRKLGGLFGGGRGGGNDAWRWRAVSSPT